MIIKGEKTLCTEHNKQPDENIRVAFQQALEEIRFFKRQQWTVTNYTALIYGAML